MGKRLVKLFCGIVLVWGSVVYAEPWLSPDDIGLRNDIQLLSDAGVITVPVTTWPLNWSGIKRDIFKSRKMKLKPAVSEARYRVMHICKLQTKSKRNSYMLFHAATAEKPFRSFGDSGTDNEKGAATFGSDGLGKRFAYKWRVTTVASPYDEDKVRLDGSYLAGVFGNWIVSVGAVDRWWGPGWQESLILSNNSRSMPSISLKRNYADNINNDYLDWVGPWHIETFLGRMEGDRGVANALLWGMRLNVKPVKYLELGFSRTAQWGGYDGKEAEKRGQSFGDFTNVITGDELDGYSANQLAAFDFRFSFPATNDFSMAVYGQYASKNSGFYSLDSGVSLFGIELSPVNLVNDGGMRLYMEAVDSKQNNSSGLYGSASYSSGYSYKGRSIGSILGNDAKGIVLGGILSRSNGHSYNMGINYLEFETDSSVTVEGNETIYLFIGHKFHMYGGILNSRITLGSKELSRGGGNYEKYSIGVSWSTK